MARFRTVALTALVAAAVVLSFASVYADLAICWAAACVAVFLSVLILAGGDD